MTRHRGLRRRQRRREAEGKRVNAREELTARISLASRVYPLPSGAATVRIQQVAGEARHCVILCPVFVIFVFFVV